jgi:SecD/SecF fusion protein
VSDYFDRIEQQLVDRVEAAPPRRSRLRLRVNLLAPAVGIAVALLVVVVFLSARGTSSPGSGSGGTVVELVYQAEPTPQVPRVNMAALERAAEIMRERAAADGGSGVSIRITGSEITVRVDVNQNTPRVERQIGTTAQLYFYDWEANALLPPGKTVASELLAQNRTAVTISQGAGEPGAGSLTLYDAVKLASKQPASKGGSEIQAQYYLFGKGGTPACSKAATAYGVIEAASGQHCLLAGPDTSSYNLKQGLSSVGTSLSQGQVLVIQPGTVVLQAIPSNLSNPPKPAAPNTQFYVLRDNVALTGNDLTNPEQSTDSGGNPDVEFGFTGAGAHAFSKLTGTIARRGSEVSGAGSKLEQHFAVALDGILITVPDIDYATYPDGIPSDHGAEIPGRFTVSSARQLATELRLGALPVGLRLVSEKHLSGRG